jgi:hypothetical protein
MERVREALRPLLDWIPEGLRGRLDVEVWALLLLVVALAVLVVVGTMLRRALRRRRPVRHWERDLREDLDDCPLPVRPEGSRVLLAYHVPVRLRLVVVAPAGKEGEVDATAVEKLLDRMVSGLGDVARRDRPRIRVWPPQLSHQGFTAAFHRCTPKHEADGEPSRWVLVAGRTHPGRQSVHLGLGLWSEQPTTIGRLNLEPHQWLDVLRLRAAEK